MREVSKSIEEQQASLALLQARHGRELAESGVMDKILESATRYWNERGYLGYFTLDQLREANKDYFPVCSVSYTVWPRNPSSFIRTYSAYYEHAPGITAFIADEVLEISQDPAFTYEPSRIMEPPIPDSVEGLRLRENFTTEDTQIVLKCARELQEKRASGELPFLSLDLSSIITSPEL